MCLLLPGPEGARDLDGDGSLRQVDGEVCHLAHHEGSDFAGAELVKELLALLGGGLALNNGGSDRLTDLFQLVNVGPDDEGRLVLVHLDELFEYSHFAGGVGG